MAGAGYRLFNTGDVLTAQQVNEYLQQQVIMRFASSAARTSALSGVLAEGMASWLDDTNSFEIYNGTAWVSASGDLTGLTAGTGITITDPTGPVPTITSNVATTFDAKGDLVVGTGADTFSKLTVGNSGDTIVADSSATTGLRYQGNYSAGKNKIINGNFDFWQRGTSSTTNGYLPDRFQLSASGGTNTFSRQAFTAGAAPFAGNEAQFFARIATSATATYFDIFQPIEDVRTFAGQVVTFSFYAKASSSVSVIPLLRQNFGSGGSANVDHSGSAMTFTSSWARYSFTTTLGSISGKTIGTGNYLGAFFYYTSGTATSNNIDTWGWQVEASNTATAFQTATGTLAGELAACQRYYYRVTGQSAGQSITNGNNESTTVATAFLPFPVTMRTAPTALEQDGTAANYYVRHQATTTNCSSVPLFANGSKTGADISFIVASGLTAGNGNKIGMNSTSAYLGWSAEL